MSKSVLSYNILGYIKTLAHFGNSDVISTAQLLRAETAAAAAAEVPQHTV